MHESKSNKTKEANKLLFVLDVVPQAKLGVDLWRFEWRFDELSVLKTPEVAAEMLLGSKKNTVASISDTSQCFHRREWAHVRPLSSSTAYVPAWTYVVVCTQLSCRWRWQSITVLTELHWCCLPLHFLQPLRNHLLSAESTRKGCRPARAAATLSASVPKVSQVYQKCWSALIREQKCWGCS